MNTLCPHIFISKSLPKSWPPHLDIINWTLDIFRNRDFSAVANFHGHTEKGHLNHNQSYGKCLDIMILHGLYLDIMIIYGIY